VSPCHVNTIRADEQERVLICTLTCAYDDHDETGAVAKRAVVPKEKATNMVELGNDHCSVVHDGHIVTITMNRPERKNALSARMLVAMYDAWHYIDATPEVRVAVLTGAGGDFCSGADLKAMASDDQADQAVMHRWGDDPDLHWKALLRHHRVSKPLIAAVEGIAVAGGTEILQATDIRVAAQGATFGVSEVRRGLFPLGGSTVRLRRQIPHTVAMDLLLTGRFITATEAKEIGLVGRVVPDGAALDTALEIAEQIAANGPLAVQAVKRSVVEGADMSEVDALAHELEIGQPIFATKDAKEGPRAFAEKRAAVFTGE
jgi:enoyl-CoA hydratase